MNSEADNKQKGLILNDEKEKEASTNNAEKIEGLVCLHFWYSLLYH